MRNFSLTGKKIIVRNVRKKSGKKIMLNNLIRELNSQFTHAMKFWRAYYNSFPCEVIIPEIFEDLIPESKTYPCYYEIMGDNEKIKRCTGIVYLKLDKEAKTIIFRPITHEKG